MSSARDFEEAAGERGRWIDARTIELLEDLEEHWGGRFDEARVRELVTAYLLLRESTDVNDGRKLTPFRRLKVDPLGL
jgi:hypothetical protein